MAAENLVQHLQQMTEFARKHQKMLTNEYSSLQEFVLRHGRPWL